MNEKVDGAYQQLCNMLHVPRNIDSALLYYVTNHLIKPILERRTPKDRYARDTGQMTPEQGFNTLPENMRLFLGTICLTKNDWQTLRADDTVVYDTKRIGGLRTKIDKMVDVAISIEQARYGAGGHTPNYLLPDEGGPPIQNKNYFMNTI